MRILQVFQTLQCVRKTKIDLFSHRPQPFPARLCSGPYARWMIPGLGQLYKPGTRAL